MKPPASDPAAPLRRDVAVAAAVAACATVAFLPALSAQFLNWDDNMLLSDLSRTAQLDWQAIRWMFTHLTLLNYAPLTWLSLSLDHRVWGGDPAGFHLTNIVLHSINAALFFAVSRLLLGFARNEDADDRDLTWGAAAAACFFALHPLRVESVAWVSERRDVLSGSFYLAAIAVYVAARRQPEGARKVPWMAAVVALHALSLLSKAIGVTLPLTLLILDLYPLRRPLRLSLIGEKAPLLVLSAVFGVIAIMGQRGVAMPSLAEHGLGIRLAQASYAAAFYLWKTCAPIRLSPLYEVPAALDPLSWRYFLSGSFVLLASAAAWRWRHRWSAGLAAWANYLIVLFPVSGILKAGQQLVADRYSYLSCLGWSLLFGGAFVCLLGEARRRRTKTAVAGSIALSVTLPALAALTWEQTHIWRDSESLWRHVLTLYPRSADGLANLGQTLMEGAKEHEAEAKLREALEFNPRIITARVNLGKLLQERGQLGEALAHYSFALNLDPGKTEAWNNMGLVFHRLEKYDEAAAHYRAALSAGASPADAAEIHNNMGLLLTDMRRFDEATAHFQEALRLSPQSVGARVNFGSLLRRQGRHEAAVRQYAAALALESPHRALIHLNLGNVFFVMNRFSRAATHYREASRLDPSNRDARTGLALAHGRMNATGRRID